MYKKGAKSFYRKEELLVPPPVSKPEESTQTSLARWEYQRMENELSDIHHRIEDVLASLKQANPGEYSRLAGIIENAIDELITRVHTNAISDFPELAGREKRKISQIRPKETPPPTSTDQAEEGKIGWAELCRLEPELLDLWSEAKEVKDTGRRKSFCAFSYFNDHLADRLTELLGPWNEHENQALNSIKSLDLAKDMLLETLPPCRNCDKHHPKQKAE